MWVAKFIIKHNCILGNRCEKFKINLQSVNFSVFKQRNKTITSSMHCMSGDPESINNFIKDLSKDKDILKIERKGEMFFLLEKAEEKGIKFHTPKIIFIKPVLIDKGGYETWEIGSWDREELNRFINGVEKTIKNFKLIKFHQIYLDNVFFPKLMPKLTLKQKRAIEIAIQEGYYQSPRKTDLRKLAKIIGISLATYQQHLRVAEEKLIPNLFAYSK